MISSFLSTTDDSVWLISILKHCHDESMAEVILPLMQLLLIMDDAEVVDHLVVMCN